MQQSLKSLREEFLDKVICRMDDKPGGLLPILRIRNNPQCSIPKRSRCPYNKIFLEDLYVKKGLSRQEIATELGTSARVIKNWLFTYGIKLSEADYKKRTRMDYQGDKLEVFVETARRKMQNSHNNWHRKGKEGYAFVFNPAHPNTTNYGYVTEHRHVVEAFLHRFLTKQEVVHHIDKDKKADNRIENLALVADEREHQRVHRAIEAWGFYLCGFTEKEPNVIHEFEKPALWGGKWVKSINLRDHSVTEVDQD